MNKPVVYIVGAGCGDADLITVKGRKILELCDCLVYDDLIDSTLLDLAPMSAVKIYVGKRKGNHYKTQDEINQILLDCSADYQCTVRLKGGDPFVFGRGGEEIEFLSSHGIDCVEIPGIASPIGIPAEYGIPVTHRGLSDNIQIFTGHSAGDKELLRKKLELSAASDGTLIFMMAVSKLEEIVHELLSFGKSPDTPVAVLSGGNSHNPYCLRSTLGNIISAAAENPVSSPGIIVVGRSAAMTLKVRSTVTVGLIGTKIMNKSLADKFLYHGIKTVRLAEAEVINNQKNDELQKIFLSEEPIMVFTSRNGVNVFFENLSQLKIDRRKLGSVKFAAIGSSTADELMKNGYAADFIPPKATTACLSDFLHNNLSKAAEVFLYRSDAADNNMASVLSEKFIVHDIRAYSCTYRFFDNTPAPDYVCFCSSSAVREYHNKYKDEPFTSKAVLIGEVTEKTFRKVYGDNYILASDISSQGIAEAVLEDYYSGQK